MFAIIVTEKGGDQRRLEFDKSEVTIGRVQGNDIILPKGNVSKRHARIVLKDGKFIIVDLKSTNGTYVNGRKITSPLVVKENDKIYIGDFILGVQEAVSGDPLMAPSMPAPQPPAPQPPSPPTPAPSPPIAPPEPMQAEPVRPEPPVPPPPAPEPPRPEMPAPRPEVPTPPRPPKPAPSAPPPVSATPSPSPMTVSPPSPQPPSPAPPNGPSALGGPAMSPPGLAPGASSTPSPAPVRPSPAATPMPIKRHPSQPRPRLVGAGARRAAARPQSIARRGVQIQPLDPKVVKMLELQQSILDRLVPKLELDTVRVDRLADESLWQRAESAIVDLVETLDSAGELPNYIDQDSLIKETLNEALGLGPLEDLLADEDVEQIIVDRRDRILISRDGSLRGSGKAFSSDEVLRRVVDRLVAPTGQVISDSHPLVDVRLRDGSRLSAAVPPVAVRGACLTLRKPRTRSHSLAELLDEGSISAEMADFLNTCVGARRNIVVCGAPGSGKSAVVAALSSAAPEGERIVSVEEVAELELEREDWVALEARPGDGNGVPPVELGQLLQSALRLRPDRLVVGDVRGGEALELVSAMSSSADGTVVAIAGDGAQAALQRLTTMARLSSPGSSVEAMRELVACAVDVVVHVARYADGVLRVASIEEISGATDDGFVTQQLFCFRGSVEDGGFAAAGVIPGFYADLEARGIPADTSIFRS